jgi:putative glutamine amidotransferase
VRVATGSMLAGILQADRPFAVPTAHHQAIDQLGAGLTATAWAADGIIEAAELTSGEHHPFVLAVQWHPEAGDDPRLFQALVAAAQSAPPPAKASAGRPLGSPASVTRPPSKSATSFSAEIGSWPQDKSAPDCWW